MSAKLQSVQLNLSDDQKAKLMKGHTVRVAHGDIGKGVTIYVPQRIKRSLETAKRKGKGKDIHLSPTDINKQGAGLGSFIRKSAKAGLRYASDKGVGGKIARYGANKINRLVGSELINADSAGAFGDGLMRKVSSKVGAGSRKRSRKATGRRVSRKISRRGGSIKRSRKVTSRRKSSRKTSKRGGSFRGGAGRRRVTSRRASSRKTSRKPSRRGGSFRMR